MLDAFEEQDAWNQSRCTLTRRTDDKPDESHERGLDPSQFLLRVDRPYLKKGILIECCRVFDFVGMLGIPLVQWRF